MLSAEEARRLLCRLGDHIREQVRGAAGIDMAAVAGATAADTIYAIDQITDDGLLAWFDQHWPDVRIVSEGLDRPVDVGSSPSWTVIVDTVDGTRGLMYGKRPAWSLAAAAPLGGTLADVVAAAMTELPIPKQGAADQLSATGASPGVTAERIDLSTGARRTFRPKPSAATDLEHGFASFAKFFPPGKPRLAQLESELFARLGCRHVFDDQYLSSGGQMYELITGHDRFVADLRPLVAAGALACHPYDLCAAMLVQRAGGVVTDPWGRPLDAPLDTTTPVAWVGYANHSLAETIGPQLAEILGAYLDG
ncbi:MAG: inositol monophosphatase [Actinomycetota bacterium]|nr:inositol monophosphatase [Actinomycetota bacterium]